MRKPFLEFLLSFFINYVVMSAFFLRDKSFNEDRNHHQYTIGTALRGISSPSPNYGVANSRHQLDVLEPYLKGDKLFNLDGGGDFAS